MLTALKGTAMACHRLAVIDLPYDISPLGRLYRKARAMTA